MQLNELIEKDGVESVSQATNISVESLQFLSEDDFSRFNRAKALGFIQILEREYELELDELILKVKEYFKEEQLEAESLSKRNCDNHSFYK